MTCCEEWAGSAKDIGIQTAYVLSRVAGGGAAAANKASAELHHRTGKAAGNGSLMRTAPVALAYPWVMLSALSVMKLT